jgi:hypothetical protein
MMAKNRAKMLPLAGCFEVFHEAFETLKRRNTQLHAHHQPFLASLALRFMTAWHSRGSYYIASGHGLDALRRGQAPSSACSIPSHKMQAGAHRRLPVQLTLAICRC